MVRLKNAAPLALALALHHAAPPERTMPRASGLRSMLPASAFKATRKPFSAAPSALWKVMKAETRAPIAGLAVALPAGLAAALLAGLAVALLAGLAVALFAVVFVMAVPHGHSGGRRRLSFNRAHSIGRTMTACQHIDCEVARHGECAPWLWEFGGVGIGDSHGGVCGPWASGASFGHKHMLRRALHKPSITLISALHKPSITSIRPGPAAEHAQPHRASYALLRPPPMRTRPHPRPYPGGIAKIKNRKFNPALTRPARSSTDRSVMAGPSADASALSTARSSGTAPH